ncbi:MAG: hypothetical protein MPW15_26245 [Candidatus Manganitrophus sp.]|nr:hypothetical protein [Candidatus Manganitrophus sp.]
MLDRIDLHIEVPAVPFRDLTTETQDESSEIIRKRVLAAREVQRARYEKDGIRCNAQLRPRQIKKHCPDRRALPALGGDGDGAFGSLRPRL